LAKLAKVDSNLENNKLTPLAKKWLEALNGGMPVDKSLEASTCRELKDIYHGLSLSPHYLRGFNNGFYIGGHPLPTRGAIAILILTAQTEKKFEVEPIYFADEQYNKQCELRGGNVFDTPPSSSSSSSEEEEEVKSVTNK
jgi:hypothetical protein